MMPIIKQSNLVLHIPFDGAVADRSASPVTVTNTGTPTYPDGKIGKCWSQGTSDGVYAQIGRPSKLEFTATSAFTIAFWFRDIDASNGTVVHFVFNCYNASAVGIIFRVNASTAGTFLFRKGTATGRVQAWQSTNGAVPNNTWTFIVGTCAAGTGTDKVKGYANGVINGSITTNSDIISETLLPATVPWNIGAVPITTFPGNSSQIQHLMAWNTELTAQEIRFLYESTKGAYLL